MWQGEIFSDWNVMLWVCRLFVLTGHMTGKIPKIKQINYCHMKINICSEITLKHSTAYWVTSSYQNQGLMSVVVVLYRSYLSVCVCVCDWGGGGVCYE